MPPTSVTPSDRPAGAAALSGLVPGAMPTRRAATELSFRNVTAIVGEDLVDDAVVVAADGRIVEVRAGGPAPVDAIDGRGAILMPGVVCTHSDGVEREIWPRVNTRFPVDFALRSFEGRLAAAGVTTVFHGVGFDHRPDVNRTIDQAVELGRVIRDRRDDGGAPADHRVLHRLEARAVDGWDAFIDALPDSEGLGHAPLVSFEDHSPGQGQYRNIDTFRAALDPAKLAPGDTVDAVVARKLAEAEALAHRRDINLVTVRELAESGRIRLLAHDLEDGPQVIEATGWGASVAEFPLSRSAAAEAVRRDMTVVMGAPNVLRGGSHSGNVAAAELIEAELCTGLASDYQPSTLLAAAFRLVRDGICSLPRAVGLVTSGPARVAGLADRGRIEVGRRADLALVVLDGSWPRVVGTWKMPERVVALA